jgi:hypothetical protein
LSKTVVPQRPPHAASKDLFVYVSVAVDDAIAAGAIAIPSRPGPVPGCSDGELLAIALVRHLLGRRSEAGFWPRWRATGATCSRFCRTKASSIAVSAGCGGRSQVRAMLAAGLPEDGCQQVDTSALRVKHTSRVRGPDGWTGPGGLAARFGRDAAHGEWFYGSRLAVKAGLGSRIVRGLGHRACRRQRARRG